MNIQNDISEDEWINRVNLAACYHLADHFQMTDIIWNHITSKTSKDKETFLKETMLFFFLNDLILNFLIIAIIF